VTEMKESVKRIENFYSDGAVFQGSMARCTWELGMDIWGDVGESRSSSFPVSPIPLSRTRFQTSGSFQFTWSFPSTSAPASLDSLPIIPDDCGATTGVPLSMSTAIEAYAIEPSPSARLFADFSRTPARGYVEHDVEMGDAEMGDEHDIEMRDEPVDNRIFLADSTPRSSSSDRDSPIPHDRLALPGVRNSKAKSLRNNNGPNSMSSTPSDLVAACSTERNPTGKSQEVDHLVSLLRDKVGRKQLLNLERDRAQNYADILDEVRYSTN
jgi:hypothetical protein